VHSLSKSLLLIREQIPLQVDAKTNASALPPAPAPPAHTLCSKFALDWDVPGGDYNRNTSSRGLWQGICLRIPLARLRIDFLTQIAAVDP